ncbi:DUF1772 domain-containing protein [uncultured Caulobacter sp.]|uniref:anthrone oxygenase family protein n=1 Tax=uncultured Caulobacter sp. TaxID=158749 RepID=UPI00260E54B5|nr:anthrone oxygenase family protein [uncultured Caulobacter sp.]
MSSAIVRGLLWTAAASSGLLGGVYFAFSSFVMASLARAPGTAGVEAMQSMNVVILRTPFMTVFFASTALAALLLVLAILGQGGSRIWAVSACLLYLIGMFGVTAFGNVPMNDTLTGMSPSVAVSGGYWRTFLSDWTLLNHLRMVASLAASGLFAIAAHTLRR